jgi:pimeloyl-ACP methyl ester carboxylesterase
MRARIVFVHGIGAPREPAKSLAEWTEALAEGCRAAGHTQFAERLRTGDGVEAKFAYYGDLFFRAQGQGAGLPDLDDDEAELLTEFMRDVIEEHCDVDDGEESLDSETLRDLKRARSQVAPTKQSQGAPELLRRAFNAATTLLGIRPLRTAGQWTLAALLVSHFSQVPRYLARRGADGDGRTLDVRVRQRILDALDGQSAVVVAHSLGSVVAMETLHETEVPVPRFVTLGSPIATRTVVWHRLLPQPPRTPECVGDWLNFWDKDDLIVARPRLEKDIAANTAGVLPDSRRVDSDGLWVHSAVKYLRRPDVAGPIAEAVQALELNGVD